MEHFFFYSAVWALITLLWPIILYCLKGNGGLSEENMFVNILSASHSSVNKPMDVCVYMECRDQECPHVGSVYIGCVYIVGGNCCLSIFYFTALPSINS